MKKGRSMEKGRSDIRDCNVMSFGDMIKSIYIITNNYTNLIMFNDNNILFYLQSESMHFES